MPRAVSGNHLTLTLPIAEPPRHLTEIDQFMKILEEDRQDLREKIQRKEKGYTESKIDDNHKRYICIATLEETAITAPDGTHLPANHINLGTSKGSIRCQFPTENAVPSFINMLMDLRVTILVVIGEEKIFDLKPFFIDKPYPPYFKESKDTSIYITKSHIVAVPTEPVPTESFLIELPTTESLPNAKCKILSNVYN